jgi:DNA-binding FrmR family transcriptional regulator
MTHTIREKQRLLARARRIRGQVEAIERALESEVGCEQVMHLLAAARGAMAGLMSSSRSMCGHTSSTPKTSQARSTLRPPISFSTLSAPI